MKNLLRFALVLFTTSVFSQAGHIMQSVDGDKTEGEIFNPQNIHNPPYGAIPGSKVGYEMTTSMLMLGLTYTFSQ